MHSYEVVILFCRIAVYYHLLIMGLTAFSTAIVNKNQKDIDQANKYDKKYDKNDLFLCF